jgi:hypothetical protein
MDWPSVNTSGPSINTSGPSFNTSGGNLMGEQNNKSDSVGKAAEDGCRSHVENDDGYVSTSHLVEGDLV